MSNRLTDLMSENDSADERPQDCCQNPLPPGYVQLTEHCDANVIRVVLHFFKVMKAVNKSQTANPKWVFSFFKNESSSVFQSAAVCVYICNKKKLSAVRCFLD